MSCLLYAFDSPAGGTVRDGRSGRRLRTVSHTRDALFLSKNPSHSDQPLTLLRMFHCASRPRVTPRPAGMQQAATGMSKKKRQIAARGERSFDHSKWRRRTVAVQLMYEGENFAGFCSQVLCCGPFCGNEVVPQAFVHLFIADWSSPPGHRAVACFTCSRRHSHPHVFNKIGSILCSERIDVLRWRE